MMALYSLARSTVQYTHYETNVGVLAKVHGVESGPHPDEVTRFGFTGMHSAGTKTVGGTNYPRLTTGSKNSGALYGVTRRDKSGVGGFSVGRFRHPPTVVFVCLAAILEGSLSKKRRNKIR